MRTPALVFLASFVILIHGIGLTQHTSELEEPMTTLLDSLNEELDEDKRMHIHDKLGRYLIKKDLLQSKRHYARALDLANATGNKSAFYYYNERLASIAIRSGNYSKALELLDMKIQEVREMGDTILIHYHYSLGIAYQQLLSFEDANFHFQQVKSLGESSGNKRMAIAVLGLIAKLYTQQGQYSEALVLKRAALQKTLGIDMPDLLAFIYKDLGNIHLKLHQPDSAIIYVRKAIEISETNQKHILITGRSYVVLSAIYKKMGKYPQALQAGKEALALAQEIHSEDLEWAACQAIGKTYLKFSHFDMGLVSAYQSLALAKKLDNPQKLTGTYKLLEKLHHRKNNYKQAYQYQSLAFESEKDFIGFQESLREQKRSYKQQKQVLEREEVINSKKSEVVNLGKFYGIGLLMVAVVFIIILMTIGKGPLINMVSINEEIHEYETELKVRFLKHTALMVGIISSIIASYYLFIGQYTSAYVSVFFVVFIGVVGVLAGKGSVKVIFWSFSVVSYLTIVLYGAFVVPLYSGLLALVSIYLAANYLAEKTMEYVYNIFSLILSVIVYSYYLQITSPVLISEMVRVELICGVACILSITATRYYAFYHGQVIRKELSKNRLFLQEIIDINPFFILTLDTDQRITYANQIAFDYLGIKNKVIIGEKITNLDLVPKKNNPFTSGNYDILEGETLSHPAFVIEDKQQEVQYVEVIKKPIYDTNQDISGILMVGINVTEKLNQEHLIKKQVEDLHEANSELKKYIESNSHLEQFAYLASHDLRTPIRTLVSFTQLLRRRVQHVVGEEEMEYIGFIIRASKNMMSLVNDILSFSRVNTEKVKLKQIHIPQLISALLQEMQVQIEEKQAEIRIGSLIEYIVADPVKIRQLLQNLISNALKFSKPGIDPVIEIYSEINENEWVFWVEDNGIGIKEEYQKKIFLLFNRLHSDIEIEGFGIGLAMCKKIVEQHEGKIGLTSEFGKGSKFYFRIPMHL